MSGPSVEGAPDAERAAVEDVGVDHGGGDVAVAEEFLDGADVVAGLKEVGREAVAEAVARGGFGEVGGYDRFVKRPLKDGFVKVMAPRSWDRIRRASSRVSTTGKRSGRAGRVSWSIQGAPIEGRDDRGRRARTALAGESMR